MVARDLAPTTSQEMCWIYQLVASSWPWYTTGLEVLGLLQGGYMNRNYLLQNATGRFVLRRYEYNTDPAAIGYEHLHLALLPDRLHNAIVPKPLVTGTGDTIVNQSGSHYALFPFVEGEPFSRVDTGLIEEAGRTLAAYHNATLYSSHSPRSFHYAPLPSLRHQRPTYGTVARLDWVARHTSGLDQLWNEVSALPANSPRERFICDSIGVLKNESRYLQGKLSTGTYRALPKLVIHNDFGPQNLLCRGGQVVALLDFDLVASDARSYDLALALFWFGEDKTMRPAYPVLPGDRAWTPNADRARVFYRAYAGSIDPPLAQAEIDLLPALMRAVLLWFAIWYLDLRVAGQEWHPEELSGILACQQWFSSWAERYISSVVHAAPAPAPAPTPAPASATARLSSGPDEEKPNYFLFKDHRSTL